MNRVEPSLLRSSIARCTGFVLATVVAASIARAWIPAEKVCPDFIQFWTAAELLSSGHNPYDVGLQSDVQRGLGWDKASDGLGIYDFLPYYYPPWLGLLCVPLLPLGYPLAKITWLVLNGELLLAASYLLKDAISGNSRWVAVVFVIAFGPSLMATVMGQISPLILFLIAAAWTLLKNGRRDFAAGCVLALATTKPQLTGLLVLGLLCRAVGSGRWDVVRGFAATLAALCLVCLVASPGWPLEMARAPSATPLPDVHFPGSGCSWLIVLKAVGLRGPILAAAYLLVAVPLAVGFLRLATDRRGRLDDLICASLVGSFFIAPYIRYYDLPILLIPALVLMGARIQELSGCALLTALTTLPYFQYLALSGRCPRLEIVNLEYTYFWIPIIILITWRCSRSDSRIIGRPRPAARRRGEAASDADALLGVNRRR